MRKNSQIKLVVLLFAVIFQFGLFVPAAEPRFKKIFDGQSLDGWKVEGAKTCWFAERQRLCCISNKKGKWIQTDRKYSQYILKLEWKVSEGARGGLLIGMDPKKTTQKDLIRIPLQNRLSDDLHCTGSLYGIAPVMKQPDSSPDRWHTLEVRYLDTGISVYCDGEKCTELDFNRTRRRFPREGYIAIQAVDDQPFSEIEFREIKIRELTNRD